MGTPLPNVYEICLYQLTGVWQIKNIWFHFGLTIYKIKENGYAAIRQKYWYQSQIND